MSRGTVFAIRRNWRHAGLFGSAPTSAGSDPGKERGNMKGRKRALRLLAALGIVLLFTAGCGGGNNNNNGGANTNNPGPQFAFAAAYSPDGRTIASGVGVPSGDPNHPTIAYQIREFDAATGVRLPTTVSLGTTQIWSLAFSPDSHAIAVGLADDSARVFDASSGAPLETLQGNAANGQGGSTLVWSLSWSPTGDRLATTHWDERDPNSFNPQQDRIFRIWNTAAGGLLRHMFSAPFGTSIAVAFSPDGTQLAGSSYGTIMVHNAETGEVLQYLDKFGTVAVWSLAYSPDGSLLAAGYDDKGVPPNVPLPPGVPAGPSGPVEPVVKIWNPNTGALVNTLHGATKMITSVAFAHRSPLVAAASADGAVRIWNVSGPLVKTLSGPTEVVRSVSFPPDDTTVLAASDDGSVWVWDLATGNVRAQLRSVKR